MFAKVNQVFISTNNEINWDAFGHRQKIQILDVADRRLRFHGNIGHKTNIVNHLKEIVPCFFRNKPVKFWSGNDNTNLIQQLLADIDFNILAIKDSRQ